MQTTLRPHQLTPRERVHAIVAAHVPDPLVVHAITDAIDRELDLPATSVVPGLRSHYPYGTP